MGVTLSRSARPRKQLELQQMTEAKQCPWCEQWALKGKSCNYIFACGLDDHGNFHKGAGCGKSWCWQCGKKFCGRYIDPETGKRERNAREYHDTCCIQDPNFSYKDYCPGGHNSHCELRWARASEGIEAEGVERLGAAGTATATEAKGRGATATAEITEGAAALTLFHHSSFNKLL